MADATLTTLAQITGLPVTKLEAIRRVHTAQIHTDTELAKVAGLSLTQLRAIIAYDAQDEHLREQ